MNRNVLFELQPRQIITTWDNTYESPAHWGLMENPSIGLCKEGLLHLFDTDKGYPNLLMLKVTTTPPKVKDYKDYFVLTSSSSSTRHLRINDCATDREMVGNDFRPSMVDWMLAECGVGRWSVLPRLYFCSPNMTQKMLTEYINKYCPAHPVPKPTKRKTSK